MAERDRAIDLTELVIREAKRVKSELDAPDLLPEAGRADSSEFIRRAIAYEMHIGHFARMAMYGSRWCRGGQDRMWLDAIQRLVPPRLASGNEALIQLRDYPAMIAFYATGVGAVIGGRTALVAQLLTSGAIWYAQAQHPWVARLHPWFVQNVRWFQALPGMEQAIAPVSDRVFTVLKPYGEDVDCEGEAFEQAFDDWELLLSMARAKWRADIDGDLRTPVGRFQWRHSQDPDTSVIKRFNRALDSQGANWAYLEAGLFDGTVDKARELLRSIESQQELQRFYRY